MFFSNKIENIMQNDGLDDFAKIDAIKENYYKHKQEQKLYIVARDAENYGDDALELIEYITDDKKEAEEYLKAKLRADGLGNEGDYFKMQVYYK